MSSGVIADNWSLQDISSLLINGLSNDESHEISIIEDKHDYVSVPDAIIQTEALFDLLTDIILRDEIIIDSKFTNTWEPYDSPLLEIKKNGIIRDFPFLEEEEKLTFPREFVLEFHEETDDNGDQNVLVTINGKPFGHDLKDNAYDGDFYRFHDVFHFSYVVILGWSPVVRGFLHKKRKKDRKRDEVEDGGRAIAIDEAISVLVFEYARDHGFFDGTGGIDYNLFRTIKMLTKHLEVKSCSIKQWEKAILLGFDMWRKLKEKRHGRIICNMDEQTMTFEDI